MTRPFLIRLAAATLILVGLAGCEPDDGTQTGVPYVPTTQSVAEAMLALAEPKPGDVLYDLGSGDGRIPITAVRKFGIREGVGIELNPDLVATSKQNAQRAGVADRVDFRQGDIFKLDFSEASIVTMYLLPEVNRALRPRLLNDMKPGTRIVTNLFDLDDWTPDKQISVRDPDPEGYNLTATGNAPLYLFIVPAKAGGVWVSGGNGTPVRLDLSQKYQMVAGQIEALGRSFTIREGKLAGERLNLTAVDKSAPGTTATFDGRVAEGAIRGTLTVGDQQVAVAATRAP